MSDRSFEAGEASQGVRDEIESLREKLAATEREKNNYRELWETVVTSLQSVDNVNKLLLEQKQEELSESQAARVTLREALNYINDKAPGPIYMVRRAEKALTLDAQTPNPLLEALVECEKALQDIAKQMTSEEYEEEHDGEEIDIESAAEAYELMILGSRQAISKLRAARGK